MSVSRLPTTLLMLSLVLSSGACTAVKPVVCLFSHPVQVLGADLDREDEEEDDEHQELPTAFALPVVAILLPVRLLYLGGAGALGGLASGIVSDLNVLTGNTDDPADNWTRAFKTNRRP